MKKKSVMSQLFAFTNGCRGKTALSIILAVIGVLCGMAPYFALAGILTEMIQNILTVQHIFYYVGIAILGETLKMVLSTLSSLEAHKITYHILENIRCKLAEKMMRVPMGVMVDTPSGKLKAMVVDTVEKLEQPLAHMLPEITANVFTPICIIIVLFALDWRMALACMLVIPVGFVLLMGQMKDYKNRADRYITACSGMDSAVVEYINGIQVIKAFSQTGTAFKKFLDAIKYYHDTTLDWWKNTWLYSALGLTVIPATLIGGIPIGAYLLMQGSIRFFIYITCLILSLGIAGPLIQATYYADSFAVINASIRQVGEFLEAPELKRPLEKVKLTDEGFRFEGVSFGYGEQEILHNITFTPVRGGKTAIVGPSGSGKTTLCNLIARFWDVQKGAILIGGKNVKDIEPDELMKLMSIVFQNVYLFHDTIENNIKFGRPDATHEAVVEAARRACCHDFIEKLPNAYQTVIGEGGSTLSGGEKQRISIARAILKDAPIVILDEATSSVDPENQHILLTAINELTKGKTLIIIAHRLSTIRNADQIVVLDGGRIVQQGTHKTLIQQDGVYRRFVQIRKTTFSWKL